VATSVHRHLRLEGRQRLEPGTERPATDTGRTVLDLPACGQELAALESGKQRLPQYLEQRTIPLGDAGVVSGSDDRRGEQFLEFIEGDGTEKRPAVPDDDERVRPVRRQLPVFDRDVPRGKQVGDVRRAVRDVDDCPPALAPNVLDERVEFRHSWTRRGRRSRPLDLDAAPDEPPHRPAE
jgi:hypothetical protein